GKTTILKAILGLLAPAAGSIQHPGPGIQRVGYVPQRGAIDEVFPFTLAEIVEMGFYGVNRPWARLTTEQNTRVGQVLKAVGLDSMTNRLFRELSGGQKQRALLARALVAEPQVLVLDEPTHGLDIAQARTLLALLDDLRLHQQLSLIVVSHNLVELLDHCQRLLLLHHGQLAFCGVPGDLTDEVLERIYGMPVRLRGAGTPLLYQDDVV
ncbi:MAG TPA: ATP-binding cassette domain-containing protein, partial [Candidatus Ozemobacteraceae bacterium]|nr:ATP-binding cassette domain-containing protein [Candidatus Ozemobacteraceae bacterium]